MSSSQQSNDALSVAEASLRKALARIKRHQADGRVSVDQAHAIALQVVSLFFSCWTYSTY
jgi:hypothetical protein